MVGQSPLTPSDKQCSSSWTAFGDRSHGGATHGERHARPTDTLHGQIFGRLGGGGGGGRAAPRTPALCTAGQRTVGCASAAAAEVSPIGGTERLSEAPTRGHGEERVGRLSEAGIIAAKCKVQYERSEMKEIVFTGIFLQA